MNGTRYDDGFGSSSSEEDDDDIYESESGSHESEPDVEDDETESDGEYDGIAIPEFPLATTELVSAIYYNIPTLKKRILLLGEYHEQDDGARILNYIQQLRVSLGLRKECLDYYLESDNIHMKKDISLYRIRSVVGGGALESNSNLKTTQHMRVHHTDYRGITRRFSTIRGQRHKEFFGFLTYSLSDDGVVLDTMLAAIESLRQQNNNEHTSTIDALTYTTRSTLNYSSEELIAFYYGIGPDAKSGNPKPKLRAKYTQDLNKIQVALTAVLEYVNRNADIEIDDAWVKYQLAFVMSLDDLASLRSRSRKTLKEFLRGHKLSLTKLFKAMQATIHMASGRRFNLSTMATEAFADIYTFLRMFRIFSYEDRDNHKCSESSCNSVKKQRNVIYLSHVGHSLNVAILIRLMFRCDPTKVFEQTSPYSRRPYVSPNLHEISSIAREFDAGKYINYARVNIEGRTAENVGPPLRNALVVTMGTKFFDDE